MGRHKLHVLGRPRTVRQRVALLAAAVSCACVLLSVVPARAAALTAWIADWDLARGLAEFRSHPGLFDSIRVFSANFDEKDRPSLAPDWARLLGRDASAVFGTTPVYLTVVNDVVAASGKGLRLKDPALVARLTASPEARERHGDALIALAKQHHFQGIEIDYENVAEEDWPNFLAFVAALQGRAASEGLALAVLLQPQHRYLAAPLPPGPQYVLMGYNLFGFHSGPGPKATPAFLSAQAAALRAIGALDATTLALATGGFDWTGAQKASQLTESEAQALLAKNRATPARASENGYLVSRYRDDAGKDHEVWHADGQTMDMLWQAAQAAGFGKLAIWRLGGNSPSLFAFLSGLKR